MQNRITGGKERERGNVSLRSLTGDSYEFMLSKSEEEDVFQTHTTKYIYKGFSPHKW